MWIMYRSIQIKRIFCNYFNTYFHNAVQFIRFHTITSHIYVDANYMSYQTLSSFCSSCTFARTKFQVFDRNWKLNVNHIFQWKDDVLHVTQIEIICNMILRKMNRWVEEDHIHPLNTPAIFDLQFLTLKI